MWQFVLIASLVAGLVCLIAALIARDRQIVKMCVVLLVATAALLLVRGLVLRR